MSVTLCEIEVSLSTCIVGGSVSPQLLSRCLAGWMDNFLFMTNNIIWSMEVEQLDRLYKEKINS